MKTFEYFKKTGEIFTEDGWDGDEGYYINYTVEDEELKEALVNILFYEFYTDKERKELGGMGRLFAKQGIRKSIDICEGWEALFEQYEEELKEEFEIEALGD